MISSQSFDLLTIESRYLQRYCFKLKDHAYNVLPDFLKIHPETNIKAQTRDLTKSAPYIWIWTSSTFLMEENKSVENILQENM